MTTETMERTDLDGLIARLEKAEGPDRELDCLIWAEFEGRDVRYEGNKLLARSRRPPHDECWLGTIDPGRVRRNFSAQTGFKPPIPNPTASIDAALALVEKVLPGAVWTKNQHDQVALSRYPTKPMIIGMGWHHHVPIAILIALLSAIKSRE